MSIQSVAIPNALRLDFQIVDHLIKGNIIAAIARTFTGPGRTFALYPDQPNTETVTISAWARCEECETIRGFKALDIISHYLAIPTQNLENIIATKQSFFLVYLRVYNLAQPITIPAIPNEQYVGLPDYLHTNDLSPVLSNENFVRIRQGLANREPPESLFNQIERILKEAGSQRNTALHQDLAWIEKIGKVGNSSGGHEFEKLVRKSFIFLGFSNSNTNPKANLDPENTGGAGGIDLCCELPYPVVGECKASANQHIYTKVCSQLTYLGQAHCPDYDQAIKIIIAAGSLNHHSRPVAIGNQMNVIKPETLEKLVKLKLDYPAAVDLAALKSCLENEPFGDAANTKLLEFINESEAKIKQEIKLRAHIVEIIKNFLQNNALPNVDINVIFGIYGSSNSPQKLSLEELRDLLIELSSPLAGYLGRVERDGKRCDQFYYLRDLAGDE